MTLSIIIVNWNTRDLLKKCLESINKEKGNLELEIFVVDNASKDGSAKVVKENFSEVNLIANQENVGFARANNQAIQESRGEYILLLNPDTLVLKNTLQKTIEFFQTHPDTGILGCKILNPDGSLQPSCRTFPTLSSQLLILLKIHNLLPNLRPIKKYYMLDFDYQEVREVDQIMGAYFMIKREVIKKIGLMDEKFWLWFEEVDYCKRVKENGFRVYFTPEAQVIHRKAQSFKQMLGPKKQIALNNSMLHYFSKNKDVFQAAILALFYPFSILLAVIVYLVELIRGPLKKKKYL